MIHLLHRRMHSVDFLFTVAVAAAAGALLRPGESPDSVARKTVGITFASLCLFSMTRTLALPSEFVSQLLHIRVLLRVEAPPGQRSPRTEAEEAFSQSLQHPL